MEKADVKEITVVRDDGSQEKVEHGAVVEMEGDDISIAFVNIQPVDIVRLAIGMVEAVRQMGMGEALDQMVSYCYGGQTGGEDADAGTEEL